MIFSKDQSYKGAFVDNRMEGKGIFTWSDGSVYDGQWKKNQMNGIGIYTWTNG